MTPLSLSIPNTRCAYFEWSDGPEWAEWSAATRNQWVRSLLGVPFGPLACFQTAKWENGGAQ